MIGEPGPEPDICTDIVETAQHARSARVQPAMKRAFVGVINGAESADRSVSGDETVVYSDGESSTGETESLYQLQDGRLGGCSDGNSIPDPSDLPNRVGIFMTGTQAALHSSTAAATTSGSAAATAAGQDALCARRLRFYQNYLMCWLCLWRKLIHRIRTFTTRRLQR